MTTDNTFKLEKVIFTETPDVYDCIAYAFTSRIKAYLEHHINRKFNGFMVTNTSAFGERRLKCRHPRSVLDKDNPFLSLSYTVDEERRDLALSSSLLSTDCGSFVDPKYTSDLIFKNDSFNPDQNVDIRLQFSGLLMNCNIAILEDSEMCQISSRRVFDTLFETDKPYSLIMNLKIPINEVIAIQLAKTFNINIGDLSKGFNENIDEFTLFLNTHSDFRYTIEFREMQNKNWIYLNMPMEVLFSLSESEVSSDGEDNLLIKNYLITRRATISFNCPNLYWIIPRSNKYNFKYKDGIDPDVVSISTSNEYVDNVTDTIEYKDKTWTSFIRGNILFGKETVVSLRPYMYIHESFLKYLEKFKIPFEDAVFILIREVNQQSRNSLESTDKVGISYKKDFFVKLFDKKHSNTAFDLAIFIDTLIHKKYLDWKSTFMFNDYNPIYNVSDGRDITISDSLKALLQK